jgi:hypothetical protein
MGLLLQNFSRSLIVMQFKVNQSFIASTLCENRDKPQMHCNGRCHLKKELDRDAQQDQNNNNNKEKYEVMFVEAIQSFSAAPLPDQIIFVSFYKDPCPNTPVCSVFHPPQSVVS